MIIGAPYMVTENMIEQCKVKGETFIGRAKRAPHWGVQSRFRVIYIYIQVKKNAFKINAKIEDVGLNED